MAGFDVGLAIAAVLALAVAALVAWILLFERVPAQRNEVSKKEEEEGSPTDEESDYGGDGDEDDGEGEGGDEGDGGDEG